MHVAGELAVIGGGVAGSVTALVAARQGRRVVLVDGRVGAAMSMARRCRPKRSQPLLILACGRRSGRWGARRAGRTGQCGAATGSTAGSTCETPMAAGGTFRTGRLIEALLRAAATEAGAYLVAGSIRGLASGDECAFRLHVAAAGGPQVVEARYAVDATGRHAAVGPRLLGARRVQHDRLVGLMVRYEIGTPDEAGADQPASAELATLVEAVSDGWWFSAPTTSGLIVIFLSAADLVDWRRIRQPHGWGAAPLAVLRRSSLHLARIWHGRWLVGSTCSPPVPSHRSGRYLGVPRSRWCAKLRAWIVCSVASLPALPTPALSTRTTDCSLSAT